MAAGLRRGGFAVRERKREPSPAFLLDRRKDVIELDLPREPPAQLLWHLVVPAVHVVLLVRGPEDPELTLTGVAEQVEQVQRALLAAFGAVLDVVGDVEHSSQIRARSARNNRL